MRTLLTIMFFAFIACASPEQPEVKTDEANTVRQTLATFINLQLKYDANAVCKMLDEEFLYVSPDGSTMNRDEFVNLTNRERNPLEILEVTNVQVRISGTTAIATGLVHEKGLLNGKAYEFRGRTLITYINKGGQWLQLACHD